jgi:hypothetical protein
MRVAFEVMNRGAADSGKHQRHPQLDDCRIGDATGTVGLKG